MFACVSESLRIIGPVVLVAVEPVAAGELLPEPSPEGRLVAAMLKAMGIPANRVYTASALPAAGRKMPTP